MEAAAISSAPGVGDPAPDFSLPGTPDGDKITLSELRGHPVVLAFFPFAFSPG